jgi:hypothetical protein
VPVRDFTLDFQLWRSDGTPEGTFAVSEQGVVATTELFQVVGGAPPIKIAGQNKVVEVLILI